ncbi:PAS domain-containing sensor histidine kinase [Candidatus Saccharibacteria bacterium]|nr:PAS domain-containing sensor histidine kinase [Candidatus Saccharibacteria bacterium]
MGGSYTYERDKFAEQFIRVMRWTSLFLPIPVILHTTAVATEFIPRSPLYHLGLAWAIATVLSLLAIWNYLSHDYSTNGVGIRLSIIAFIMLGFFVVITGLASPIVMIWIIIAIMADIFFSKIGFYVMLAAFLVTTWASLDTYILNEQVTVVMTASYTIGTSFFVYFIRKATYKKHVEFEQAKERHAIDHSQLTTVLNSIRIGIATTNVAGDIRLYNAAFLNLLDTNKNVTKQPFDTVLPLVDSDGNTVSLLSIAEKSSLTRRDDLTLRYRDGDEIRVGITINPVRSAHNMLRGYICIVEDITKEKNLDEERDEFISVISHELRTPIAITEGSISNAQLLLERKSDTQTLKSTFGEAHDQIVYLANMVNDLGTLSRAERGVGDTLEEIDVDDLAHSLYGRYSKQAVDKGLTLDIDITGKIGSISTSRLYLEEMLQNFITNSLKYTQTGNVSLNIKRVHEGIRFAVKDSGIGISKSDQKRIFEKFYRSEDYRTRETSGTGLGLYVVSKLARKLNTNIEITSRLNHGSEFSFVLPIK